MARLATSRQGMPHVVPVVFCESAGALWVPIDGKRKSGRPLRRLANIAANPAVALLVDEYAADWSRLRWVRVDGEAAVEETDATLAEALRAKYPQYQTVPMGAQAIRIVPRQVRRWAA